MRLVKMNRAQRNNNCLNLRFAHQHEASGQDDDGFAAFPSPAAGWRAAHAQIELDKKRGLTIEQFINKFAPPNENDTRNYLEFILDELQVEDIILLPTVKLFDVSTYGLVGIMAKFEGYYNKE